MTKASVMALRAWHAVLAGGFLVAFLTGDEDTYAMHLFAGYLVLAALAVRLVAALFAPAASMWRLGGRKGRNPLFTRMAVVVAAVVTVVAGTGWAADRIPALEHLHEGLSEGSAWVIAAHAVLVWLLMGGRGVIARLKARFA
jgi:cytochrome b